ncbi:hypothetical protein EG835_03535, partial [bacterium]|nr:hypothetical protein [bacterium]
MPAQASPADSNDEIVIEEDAALVAARHIPSSLEPAAVVRALLDAAAETGNAVAAHLWIRDESSGGLRLVAAEGALGPGIAPMRQADEVIESVAAKGEARLAPVSRVTT